MRTQSLKAQSEPVWRSGLVLGRRTALQLMLAIPAVTFGAVKLNASSEATSISAEAMETLAELLDILLPKTDESPAASELDLATRILSLANTVPNYPSLLENGLNWIAETSRLSFRNNFMMLSKDKREAVVKAAFAQADQTLPRVFAKRLRDDAMTIFYSHPASWPALDFEGPIQPSGFLDFEKAPPP